MKVLVLTLAACFCAFADVSGTWKIEGDVMGNTVDPVCTFKAAGNKLTGSCKNEMSGSDISGQLDGNKLSFQWEVSYQGETYVLSFSGTLSSDTEMTGSIAVAGVSGVFSAKKQ